MAEQLYEAKKFQPQTKRIIDQAREILEAYYEDGYVLTLRQLYYQFVARALFKFYPVVKQQEETCPDLPLEHYIGPTK